MITIIACASIKPELEHIKAGAKDVQIRYLPQNLHRTPEKLKKMLQNKVNEVKYNDGKLVLGFGLCSNAIIGIKAPQQGMYVPCAHDCITFFLGSREKYNELFRKYPGTYYLTKSWIGDKKDPLGLLENEYTQRVGKEMAEETMRKEIINYDYISFINTLDDDRGKCRERAKENAKFFKKKFIEHKANNDFFGKIVFGPHQKPDFIYIEAYKSVKQQEILKLGGI